MLVNNSITVTAVQYCIMNNKDEVLNVYDYTNAPKEMDNVASVETARDAHTVYIKLK